MGERASFLVRIDPDVLAKFDDLAWSHRVRRNELIAALIESYALGEVKLSEERIQGNKRKKSGRPKKTEEVKTNEKPVLIVHDDDDDALYGEDDLM